MQITKQRLTAAIKAARFPGNLGEMMEEELQRNLGFLNFFWNMTPSATIGIWLSLGLVCIADASLSDEQIFEALFRLVSALFDDFEEYAVAKQAVLEMKRRFDREAA